MCVFLESQALVFRKCAPDTSHKHMNFNDFHESAPAPSQELNENHDIRTFPMAAEENKQIEETIGRRNV